jgi:AraC family transcriptional regulator
MDTPIEKALWFIESHFTRDVSLDEVADICGVSRFRMSRAFGEALGLSLTQYLRGRRLTEAARTLAAGAPDILAIALEAGYSSHEAFTRAFHEQFGLTPAELRARGRLDGIALVEPVRRDRMAPVALVAPRLERLGPLSIAGLGERFPGHSLAGIPALWQRFREHLGHVPGQIGTTAYGVCMFTAEGRRQCHYLAGVEVAELSEIGDALTGLRVPSQRYAVFAHPGHITTILSTLHAMWSEWLPSSGQSASGFPDLIERYDERFDARTGSGGLELWLPLKG